MIYFLQGLDGGPVKIGTAIDVDARQRHLEARSHDDVVESKLN